MALQLSTGLVNKMMGMQATLKGFFQGVTGAYVEGGTTDQITASGNNLQTSGFAPGQIIWTKGSTTSGNNMAGVELVYVSPGVMGFTGGTIVSETFAAATCAISFTGGSVRDIFHHGVLRIFSGTVPSTADAAITGTLLAQISISNRTFVAGQFYDSSGNVAGLTFGAATAGVIGMTSGEVWSGTAVASGTATHYRIVGNASDANTLSTSLPRIQGTVSTSGADATMPSTSITTSQVITVSSWTYTLSPT